MAHGISFAVLALMLFTKHFIADGPLQSKYQLDNKGRFLHRGGLEHAALHAVLTALCVTLWAEFLAPMPAITGKLIVAICCAEFVAHYLIDWTKSKVEQSSGWVESVVSDDGRRQVLINDKMFFMAFLADQMLHSFCYVLIVLVVAGYS